MPFPAHAPGGLRPAYAELPPTLTPHAVLAVAPRPDRSLSLLAACAVYLAAGTSAWLLSRKLPVLRPPITHTTHQDWNLRDDPEPRPPELPARAAAVPRQDATEETPAQPDSNVPPEDPPEKLPVRNRSDEGTRPATEGELREGVVKGGNPDGGHGGTAIGDATSVVHDFSAAPPRVLQAEHPLYPGMARAARLQGPVELRMFVDERGLPVRVEVLSGHPAFHAEAERAARRWRFEPARVDGRAVPAQFRLTIAFRLQ